MTRALMDNLNATNKSRTAFSFDELVEADDLTDGRINGNIRVKPGVVPDVRMAVTAFLGARHRLQTFSQTWNICAKCAAKWAEAATSDFAQQV